MAWKTASRVGEIWEWAQASVDIEHMSPIVSEMNSPLYLSASVVPKILEMLI